MSRFVLSIENLQTNFDINLFKESLTEISSKEEIQIKIDSSSKLLYSYLSHEPIKGQRYFEDENWTVFLAGELIDYSTVPFKKIIDIIDRKSFNEFKNLNGVFAIIVRNKKEEKNYIISDRRSQYPLYYYFKNETAIISSDLSSFCRLLDSAKFNEKWLYDYMFFHYPIGDGTFLENVKRLSYSSVLIYYNKTKEIEIIKYAEKFQKKENLLKGKEGIEYAKEVFKRRVPKYFEGPDNIACALTGGWDGRTNVALAPDRNKITTYTYGSNDCSDFVSSRKAVKKIKTNHLEINFDDEFIEGLKTEMFETVFLSSGTQSIQRSTLLGVYSRLADFSVVLSGINYDGLFRGNVGGPSLVSPYVINIFKNGRKDFDLKDSHNVFLGVNGKISNEITERFNLIENEFGDLHLAESHLLYTNYMCDPQYFLGEYKIAELFTTLRVPAWDYEIIDLAFSIEQSTLNFSELVRNQRGAQDTMVLQANLISEFAPELFNVPIKLSSPKEVLKNEFLFNLYGQYRRATNKISKNILYRNQKPLEDWNSWLNVNHKSTVDNLIFSNESLIQNYFTKDYLREIKTKRDHRTIGKLCTIEIILRLINNKWKKFW